MILFPLLLSFTLFACLPTPASTDEVQTEEATQDAPPAETEPATEQTLDIVPTGGTGDGGNGDPPPTPTTIGTVTADFGDITDLAEIIRLPEGTLEAKMLTNKPININLGNMSVYSFNFSVSGYTFTPTPYSGGNYQVLPGKNPGQTLVAFTNGASGQTVPVNVTYTATDSTGASYDFTMPLSFKVTGTIPTQPKGGGGGQGGSGNGGSGGSETQPPGGGGDLCPDGKPRDPVYGCEGG